MRRLSIVPLAVVLALLAGCGDSKSGQDSKATGSTAADTTTAAPASSGPCRKVAQPKPKDVSLAKPTTRLDRHKHWTAVVTTNCGAFTIALDVAHDPKTASSFAYLARKGFYDGLTFHRIAPGFVIQGGDPLGDGTGGPGYTIVEAPPADTQYSHGVVAMAKTGNDPDGASGSQFFVMTGDSGLPPQYAVLGKVVKGLDVIDAIDGVPRQTEDPGGAPPVDPVVMSSVRVSGR